MGADLPDGVTRDAFLGGRLHLLQPRSGHRAGTDAVLLAAAVPHGFAGHALDVGAGVGSVGLAVALAHPDARVTLLERDVGASELAERNAVANGLGSRVDVVRLDLFSASAAVVARPIDLVVTNPPFHAAERVRGSPDAARRAAHVLAPGKHLADWITASVSFLASKGEVILIAPVPALAEILAALAGRAGAVHIKTVHPRMAAPAHRILVRARKGSRAPLTICPPLILHEGDAFTPEAAALHRGETRLVW